MIFLTKEELAVPINSRSSRILFRDKLFNRGPDFSNNARHSALEFCQQYSNKLSCLVVDNYSYISIWIEDTSEQNAPKVCHEENYTEASLHLKPLAELAIVPVNSGALSFPDRHFDNNKLKLLTIETSLVSKMKDSGWLKAVAPFLAMLLLL